MGQYHTVYNIDKKEYFSHGGAKLWEKAYSKVHSMGLNVLLCNSNGRGGGDLCNPIHKPFGKSKSYTRWSNEKQATIKCPKEQYLEIERAIKAVSGRWAGDRIVIQGDYAKSGDKAFLTEAKLKGFKDITPLVEQALLKVLSIEAGEEDDDVLKELRFESAFRGGK